MRRPKPIKSGRGELIAMAQNAGERMTQPSSLPLYMQYGYGLAEFGINFLLTFVTYYLSFFLTNIALLPTAIAATVVTITTIIKCITMPVAGVVIDKVQFKNSRYRLWALIGAVIFFIGGSLMFTDLHLSVEAYAVVFVIFFFVYWLGYSIAWVAHRALMEPLSKVPADKLALSSASAQMGAIARVVYMMAASAILGLFSTTEVSHGYTMVALVFGCIAVIGYGAVYLITKKYDNAETMKRGITAAVEHSSEIEPQKQQPKLTAHDMLVTLKNRPMVIFFVSMVLRCAILTLDGVLIVYYITYVIGDPNLVTLYMTLVFLVAFLGALIVKPLANRIGKRTTFIVASLLSVLSVLALLITGTNAPAFVALMALFHFLSIICSTLVPAFIADIAEYSSIRYGSRARAFAFSIGGLSIQVASVLGSVIAAFGLVAIGFNAAQVTTEVVERLSRLFIYGVSIPTLVSSVLFFAYPLTEKAMDELRRQAGKSQQA